MGKPDRIRVAGVAKTVRQSSPIHPVLTLPPGMRGLDHIHALHLHSIASLVLRYQCLMKLFSRPNADGFDCAAGCNAFSKVDHLHTRNLGNKDFAAMHLLQAADHEADALVKGDPEAGHTRVGNRNLAALTLFEKHWNHTAPAAHHVAVARTAEARVLRSSIGIGLNKHLLRAELGGA